MTRFAVILRNTGLCRLFALPCSILLWTVLPATSLAAGFYDSLPDVAEAPADNSLWLEYTDGADEAQDGYAELDLALSGGQRLIFGAGRSQLGSGGNRYQLDNYRLGWNSPYGSPFEAGLRFDYWGDPAELRTRSLALPLRWNHARGGFWLEPRFSWIDLYTRSFPNQRRRFETRSSAIEAGLDWYGQSGWDLSLQASQYQYADEVAKLDSPLAQFLLNEITTSLSRGLPDRSAAIELGYTFGQGKARERDSLLRDVRLGLRYEHLVSAVDNSRADATSVNLNLPLRVSRPPHVSLYLETGRLSLDTGPDQDYVKAGTRLDF